MINRCWTASFRVAPRKGIGFVIGAVFASGILATGAVQGARYAYAPATPEILAKVARIEAVCERHGVPLAAAALQFPFGHPSVASVIPGGLAPEHVTANVAAFRHPIPPALWAELKARGPVAGGCADAVAHAAPKDPPALSYRGGVTAGATTRLGATGAAGIALRSTAGIGMLISFSTALASSLYRGKLRRNRARQTGMPPLACNS